MILDHGYWAGLTLYPQTKVSAAARRRHHRALRPRSHLHRRRLRLGPERFDGRAALHHGDAAAATSRSADPPPRVREPGAVPEPVAEVQDPAGATGAAHGALDGSRAPSRTELAYAAGPIRFHLTYCTNIHAADGWDGVFANLRTVAPALKARFSPAAPFGVGLRLSAREARELLDGNRLRRLPHVPRRRGSLRRHHQRLPLRPVPRHAGQGQRLRARTGATMRGSTTRST